MKDKIKVCIIGLGNCASSLIQGIYYYKNKYSNYNENNENTPGLMHWDICGYKPYDIEISAAFDIDKRKVNKDISDAIFELPNCTNVFYYDIPKVGIKVKMGRILDSISPHMANYDENYTFVVANEKEPTKEDIINILKQTNTEILLNYLPVGSEEATKFYAECALESNVAFINAIPEFVVSNSEWCNKFKTANIPIIGDDIKSMVGATILNRYIVQMIIDRGGKIDNIWQLNYGGNCDFLNMLDRSRLKSKKISKTESVQSILGDMKLNKEDIHIGPSDYIPHLKDNKICDIRIDFRIFGNIPCSIDCKLSVEDSPNSAGCIVDCIRIVKLALDRKIGGPIIPACAWFMKHPPTQMKDEDSRKQLEDFINNKI